MQQELAFGLAFLVFLFSFSLSGTTLILLVINKVQGFNQDSPIKFAARIATCVLGIGFSLYLYIAFVLWITKGG